MTISTDSRQTLTMDDISGLADDYNSDPHNRLMQNTVTQRDVNEVALDHRIATEATHTFSTGSMTGLQRSRGLRAGAGCSAG